MPFEPVDLGGGAAAVVIARVRLEPVPAQRVGRADVVRCDAVAESGEDVRALEQRGELPGIGERRGARPIELPDLADRHPDVLFVGIATEPRGAAIPAHQRAQIVLGARGGPLPSPSTGERGVESRPRRTTPLEHPLDRPGDLPRRFGARATDDDALVRDLQPEPHEERSSLDPQRRAVIEHHVPGSPLAREREPLPPNRHRPPKRRRQPPEHARGAPGERGVRRGARSRRKTPSRRPPVRVRSAWRRRPGLAIDVGIVAFERGPRRAMRRSSISNPSVPSLPRGPPGPIDLRRVVALARGPDRCRRGRARMPPRTPLTAWRRRSTRAVRAVRAPPMRPSVALRRSPGVAPRVASRSDADRRVETTTPSRPPPFFPRHLGGARSRTGRSTSRSPERSRRWADTDLRNRCERSETDATEPHAAPADPTDLATERIGYRSVSRATGAPGHSRGERTVAG